MSPAITTTVVQTVKLSPALRTKVLKMLQIYAETDAQMKAIKTAKVAALSAVERLFEQAGEAEALDQGCAIDGFKLKVVMGRTSTLNVKFLMEEFGVTAEMLEQATESKAKKPYLKITVPGGDEEK